ncbi:ATP-grasp domain-containing protein [Aliirhizobium smilacinae]|uniref:ATP-grasp domain-containing protein n=1 Tax=Aliirhizobium smilacinae TaxID=1395944 RepID=A0A5C4X939_9HYPH|nr:ATP-grasp domain-containing protein [Rhizobium smilacinae]TNM59908.1 ATP-grasp domain-containing protein [Rhizobium smilacinae]
MQSPSNLQFETNNRPVVIVDAYSSANALAEAFSKEGFECVHVQTSQATPPLFVGSEKPEFFKSVLVNTDFEETVAALAAMHPFAIVPGAESGVDLADALATRLSLMSNDPRKVGARRDKFRMQEEIRLAGLRAIPQVKVQHPDEAVAWAEEHTYPVVAKPIASAGSDSIFICHNGRELREAVVALVGKQNVLGNINDYALVQKLITGEQYVVNTVSCDGRHVVTDMWHSRRLHEKGRSIAYDYAELLPYEGDIQEELIAYSVEVLAALGIRYGAAHTELFVTSNGPVLIETGARMVGSGVPRIVSICTGHGQLELTVLAYTDPFAFQKRLTPYTLIKNARLVAMISRQTGTLITDPDLSEIRKLRSFHYARMYLKKGDTISRTTDLISSPGDIHLIHADVEQLDIDLKEVRRLEQTIFEIADASTSGAVE